MQIFLENQLIKECSWSRVNLGITGCEILEIDHTPTLTIVVSAYNSLFVSTDNGTNWIQHIEQGMNNWIRWISIINANKIFISLYTSLVEATNLGLNWRKIPLGPTHNLESVISVLGGEPFAIGWKQDSSSSQIESVVISSPPTWRVKSVYPNTKLKCIYAKNNSEIFIGGYDYTGSGNSVIYKTNGNGDTLHVQYFQIGKIINSISFSDANNGFAVGEGGLIIKSINGGDAWMQDKPLTSEDLNFITFYNSQIGFVCGSNGTLIKTTDGGMNWNQNLTGTNKKINSIYLRNQNEIWIVGDDGLIMKSEDLGEKWVTINSSSEYNYNSIAARDTMHIGVYGGSKLDNSLFFSESHDGGISWIPGSFNYLKTLKFTYGQKYNNYAWSVGDFGTIIVANNPYWFEPVELVSFNTKLNGENIILQWSTSTELNNQEFEIQRKFGSNDFITIGSVKGHGTTTSPNSYTYIDKLVNAGKYFYRLKQIDYGEKFEYSQEVEVNWSPFTSYKLEQNYSNPFNPTTKISWQSPVSGWQTLKVFGVLGNEITTLVDEEKEAGYYSVDFNASDLPSGVYFYQLRAGDFVDTKKMVLLR